MCFLFSEHDRTNIENDKSIHTSSVKEQHQGRFHTTILLCINIFVLITELFPNTSSVISKEPNSVQYPSNTCKSNALKYLNKNV